MGGGAAEALGWTGGGAAEGRGRERLREFPTTLKEIAPRSRRDGERRDEATAVRYRMSKKEGRVRSRPRRRDARRGADESR